MAKTRFDYGDQVRHPKRPEWGIGSVVKAQDVVTPENSSQRVSVRFPNAGLKVLSTAVIELEPVEVAAVANEVGNQAAVASWDRVQQSGWLASVAERKIDEAMVTLSEAARDPFGGIRERLRYTLGLYRFDRTGSRLLDWAIAQSGLSDPLSRFTRHELEVYFDRWAGERDAQLQRLLRESDATPAMLRVLLETAPEAARSAVRRLS